MKIQKKFLKKFFVPLSIDFKKNYHMKSFCQWGYLTFSHSHSHIPNYNILQWIYVFCSIPNQKFDEIYISSTQCWICFISQFINFSSKRKVHFYYICNLDLCSITNWWVNIKIFKLPAISIAEVILRYSFRDVFLLMLLYLLFKKS